MSIENITAFFERAQNDSVLGDRVRALQADITTDIAARVEALTRLAAETGHAFTVEEFRAYSRETPTEDTALSDEILSGVAGGVAGSPLARFSSFREFSGRGEGDYRRWIEK